MIQLLGNRGASAAMGFLMLARASTEAAAQTVTQSGPAFDISAAVKPAEADTAAPVVAPAIAATPVVRAEAGTPAITPTAIPAVAAPQLIATPAKVAIAPVTATKPAPAVLAAYPATTANALTAAVKAPVIAAAAGISAAAPAVAREAAWLFRNGWPLYALVDRYGAGAPLDEQANCMAVAVYFEARGESLEGQLAVARVIMNRAASGKYPPSWCATVKQPWQFSFVNPRTGQHPAVNTESASWRKAQAIARLAATNIVPSLANDVLWYHADYVAPSWGRRLSFVSKIGTHIFYRS